MFCWDPCSRGSTALGRFTLINPSDVRPLSLEQPQKPHVTNQLGDSAQRKINSLEGMRVAPRGSQEKEVIEGSELVMFGLGLALCI